MVTNRFLLVAGGGGVAAYVIYDRADGREDRLHAAFWLNIVAAVFACTIALALAPLIGRFYALPGLVPVLAALVGAYFLQQLSVVPDAVLRKSLNYRLLAIRDTVLEVTSSLVSVTLAIRGFGVWSLVAPQVLTSALGAASNFRLAGWAPTLKFGFRDWPRIFRFSSSSIIAETANTLAAEGDTLVIGKTLGLGPLGIYNLAWTTANLVSRNVSGVVGRIALPALSAIADDESRLRAGVGRIMRTLAITSFPLLVGMFVLADKLVLTLYGTQWAASVLPLRILIVFALRRAVGAPVTALYDVLGRPDIGMKLSLLFIPCYLLSIWIGSYSGIVGVAAAVTLVRTFHGFLQFYVVARLLKISMGELLGPLMPALSSSLIMGAAVFGASAALDSYADINTALSLLLLSAFGAACYVALLRTAFKELAQDVVSLIPSDWKSVRGAMRRVFGFA
jgi:PST family polysaccharide transporter